MNTPVSFEIAKLLKEKGFDEPAKCYACDGTFQDRNYLDNYNHSIFHYGEDDYLISAPTIAEVVMWLYEKYDIWIECLHRGDMGDFTFKVSKLKKGWRVKPHYIYDNGFDSPTEAYEAAIEYTLNNLI